MNIVVLAGGYGKERQVSLSSGGMVARALREAGHDVLMVDSYLGVHDLPSDIRLAFKDAELPTTKVEREVPDLQNLAQQRTGGMGEIGDGVIELCRAADIVYMALHGDDGENGRMQAFLDMLGIKYTGAGYFESALAMNKNLAKQLFAQNGVLSPEGRLLSADSDVSAAFDMTFPLIVKPCSGGSSVGLYQVENEAELKEAFAKAAQAYEGGEVLIEQKVVGREFTVALLGEEALPVIEIIPKGGMYDYEHKYQAGWTEEVCPAEITEEQRDLLQKAALLAYKALGLSVYARADFILTEDNKPYCLEVNTLPGMTPTSLVPQAAAAAGMGYSELCDKMIALSLEKYR